MPLYSHTHVCRFTAEPGFDLAVRTWTVERGLTLAVYVSAPSAVLANTQTRPHCASAQAGGTGHSRGMRCHRVLQRRQGIRTNTSSREG